MREHIGSSDDLWPPNGRRNDFPLSQARFYPLYLSDTHLSIASFDVGPATCNLLTFECCSNDGIQQPVGHG